MASIVYTNLNVFKTSTRATIDPDDQVIAFIKLLDGKISSWQIIAPTPNQRILYYEMEDGRQAKQVEGSAMEARLEALGELKRIKKETKK
jgi:hypothetical protein